MNEKEVTKLKILVTIQMVAIISLILVVLIWPINPAFDILIIAFGVLKAIGTISYYIVITRLNSALEAESERILREYLNSNTYNTNDRQQNKRS